jgi:hypothetical protein
MNIFQVQRLRQERCANEMRRFSRIAYLSREVSLGMVGVQDASS